MKIHSLNREAVSIGGFHCSDRVGGHVDRVKPRFGEGLRLMIAGSANSAGFGLCGTDTDMFYNLGPGQPTAHGPYLGAYGLCSVIDNRGGTRREIDEAEAAGLVVRAEIGDLLEIDLGEPELSLFRIDWSGYGVHVDRHNLRLTRVEVVPVF